MISARRAPIARGVPDVARGALLLLPLLLGAVLVGRLTAQENRQEEEAPGEPVVRYGMDVRFFPERHTVEGKATVTWVSPAEEPVADVWFHLYLNAFKNERSSLLRETPASARERFRKGEWGSIDIRSMVQVVGDGEEGRVDLLPSFEYRQPDDGNSWDQTVARVELAEAVQPRESVTLEIEFVSRFPHAFSRTGYHDSYLLAAQWYPKLGVYRTADQARWFAEPWNRAGWYCPQYHAHSEFFADFGSYEVSLTAPQGHVIGATGRCDEPVENGDGTRTWTFRQDRVHDFAWAADPEFVVEERTFDPAGPFTDLFSEEEEERYLSERVWVKAALSLTEPELALRPVEVRLLLQPEHADQATRIFKAVFAGLRYYGLWYGAYPYETITVVDPVFGGRATGGMEYPTFITIGSHFLAHPRGTRPEGVTLHEFAHQYWYGLVANDEFEEAWLDEGITVYTTSRILDTAYGDRILTTRYGGFDLGVRPVLALEPRIEEAAPLRSLTGPWREVIERLGLPENALLDYLRDLPHLSFLPEPKWDRFAGLRGGMLSMDPGQKIRTRSYDFVSRETYARAAYVKAPLALMTLENVVGKVAFLKALREFQSRFRYAHPRGEDFLATLTEVSGRDCAPLFGALFDSTATLDYEVVSVESRKLERMDGIYDQGSDRIVLGPTSFEKARERRKKERGFLGFLGRDDEGEGGDSLTDEGQYTNRFVVRRRGSLVIPVTIRFQVEGQEPRSFEWDGEEAMLEHSFESEARLEWVYVDPERKILLDLCLTNNVRYRKPESCAAWRYGVDLMRWAMNMLHYYGNFG